MDAPEELREMVAEAMYTYWYPLSAWASEPDRPIVRQYRQQADAVLAVPAIADALARDRKVAEIVAERSVDGLLPISDAEGFRFIAALYPETTS